MPTLKAEFSGGNDNGATVHSPPATKAAQAAVGGANFDPYTAQNPLTLTLGKKKGKDDKKKKEEEAKKKAEEEAAAKAAEEAAAEEEEDRAWGPMPRDPFYTSNPVASSPPSTTEFPELGANGLPPSAEAEAREAAPTEKPNEHTVILFEISEPKLADEQLEALKNEMINSLNISNDEGVEGSNEQIGYSISVAYESTGMFYTSKNQYLGITLNLTYLRSKTGKGAEKIFEICRNVWLKNEQKPQQKKNKKNKIK